MDISSGFTGLWAQQTTATEVVSVPAIALKRWYGSLTLSSPDPIPNRFGVWAWIAGIAALLLIAIVAQGPRKAIGQFFDIPGHLRLLSAALARLRRAGRLVAILLGATVVGWTTWQALLHAKTEKRAELSLLLGSKSRAELAIEQGILAASTPLRDLLGLGDTLVLVVATTALIFKFSADRWGRYDDASPLTASRSGRTTLCWGAAGLYALYRLSSLLYNSDPLEPLGGCLFVEIGAVPLLMVLTDGLILAWILVELRGESSDDQEGFDVAGSITLLPAAVLACLLALPARYVATTVGLAAFGHLPAKVAAHPVIGSILGGWGLVGLQAASLSFVGVVGAAAWSRGSWRSALGVYGRTLRAEGGHLAAVVAVSGVGIGIASAVAYYLVLALPAQPWVLLAADGYAHYASLPLGLITVSALVELSGRVPREAASPQKRTTPTELREREGVIEFVPPSG